jgi:hypothetical protein
VDLKLVGYIRQLLQMGYDIASIRNRLISSGYDLSMVDEAINSIYHPAAEKIPEAGFLDKLKSRKFLAVFTGIILIIILALVILTFAGGGGEPIDVFVYLDSSEVYQGEELSFSKSLANVEGVGMVSMRYEVVDQIGGSTVATGQESFSTQAARGDASVAIPSDAPPGAYSLVIIASYAGQRAEKAIPFTVLEKIEAPPPVPPGFEEPPVAPPAGEADTDNDGTPDSTDTDDDNDGIPDAEDQMPLDHDNDGTPDSMDSDIDDDGILNQFDDYFYDRDNDGIADIADTDSDNDGIPDSEDVYPFDYDNDGTKDKDDDSTGRIYSLPDEQQTAELSFACATDLDCNDYDICTADACVSGFCNYERQMPCCGNFICELAETSDSCPEDCGEAGGAADPTQKLIDEIMEIADNNPEQAAVRCEEIESAVVADICFTELAKTTSNNAFCERVYSSDAKDKCFMYFVMSLDQFQLCEQIEKRILQNSCYAIKSLKEKQQT